MFQCDLKKEWIISVMWQVDCVWNSCKRASILLTLKGGAFWQNLNGNEDKH